MSAPTPIQCPAGVCAGAELTKEKRHEVFGQAGGGAGSTAHEKFARQAIEEGTGTPCQKTNVRVNLRTNVLKAVAHPNKHDDGFDYTEDFDGVQTVGGNTVYVNLKCVVGKGGVQTRSLREVYWFVEGQLRVLLGGTVADTYFANILDGDESHQVMPKFAYLLSLPEFAAVKGRIYVGDLRGYFGWVKAVASRD